MQTNKLNKKSVYIITEVLDERGRFISNKEFLWIINYFRDRYDPRRLSFALCYTTGLRYHDGVYAKIKWFNKEFTQLQMAQCKPHVNKRDGVIRAKMKPKFVPLPDWLAEDLRNYVRYRLLVGKYVGIDIGNGRLFPTLRKHQLRQLFMKLRIRYGDKETWLKDVWQVIKAYDKDKKLLWQREYFRVACHAARANYCTAAYQIADKDLQKTKVLTGHDETKDVEKYVKVLNIMESKMLIKEKFMDNLTAQQPIPLLVGQKKLSDYSQKKW